tara:strand:+ start:7653 stop:7826 length:174 start_codon:yes stop_codon:yes gene_type:complete
MQYNLRALPLGASSKLSGGYSSVGRAPDCDSDIHDLKNLSFISILRLYKKPTNLVKP